MTLFQPLSLVDKQNPLEHLHPRPATILAVANPLAGGEVCKVVTSVVAGRGCVCVCMSVNTDSNSHGWEEATLLKNQVYQYYY